MMGRFVHLKTGLAAVLVFVGAKMLASHLYHVPIWVSLGIIAALIGGSVVTSLRATSREPVTPGGHPDAMSR